MYATCLFCNKPLGANEALEAFPVGRRVAFDAAKGRLWVVCSQCERWNLSPLEERWEAIEQAERLYSETRKRVATDQVGLARLRDGTDLIRIGTPLRPEFAAWRYGDQFGRRRKRQILIAGAGVTAVGAVLVGGAWAGATIGSFAWGFNQLGRVIIHGNPSAIVARIPVADGRLLQVRRKDLSRTQLAPGRGGDVALTLRHKHGTDQFDGADAQRVAGLIVPQANRFGGSPRAVAEAVQAIEARGGPDDFVRQLAPTAEMLTRIPEKKRRGRSWAPSHGLFGIPAVQRLALEMALHEEAERRAMEGELALLEAAWREAEEIAAIADDLLLPDGVRAEVSRLKGGRGG